MDTSILIQKAFDLAELLFRSEKLSLTRSEINVFLEGFSDDEKSIINKSLTCIERIQNNSGKPGGISFVKGQGFEKRLIAVDKKNIEEKIRELVDANQNKKERNQDELKVLEAFKAFLNTNFDNRRILIDFKQNQRAAAKWQNIDGYKIEPQESRYHLSFSPVFTTYEVKKGIPNLQDIYQVRNYVQFSHYVFLVFYDERSDKEIMNQLHETTGFDTGFDQKDDYVGIFVTSNLDNFREVKKPKTNNPSQKNVDDFIDTLLSVEHKKKLEEMMHQYLMKRIKDAI